MIKINNITANAENESLWINFNVFSDSNQTNLTKIHIFLSGEEEQSSIIETKLIKGDNSIDVMFPINPYPWYPQGMGPINVYEINIKAQTNEEYDNLKTFVKTDEISYTGKELIVYGAKSLIFGTCIDTVSISKIDFAQKCGFNTIFTNDRKQSVIDYCILKGIVLLPYEVPTCKISEIEDLRKANKKIILEFNDLKDFDSLNKLFAPIYAGKDFISNNTSYYIYGNLKQGILNPIKNEIVKEKATDITLSEFSTYNFSSLPYPKKGEIVYNALWQGSNILAKYTEIGKETEIPGGNILISRFQIDETTWEILFGAKEFIKNLHIVTDSILSKNDFDIFPNETVAVTFFNVEETPKFELKINK